MVKEITYDSNNRPFSKTIHLDSKILSDALVFDKIFFKSWKFELKIAINGSIGMNILFF